MNNDKKLRAIFRNGAKRPKQNDSLDSSEHDFLKFVCFCKEKAFGDYNTILYHVAHWIRMPKTKYSSIIKFLLRKCIMYMQYGYPGRITDECLSSVRRQRQFRNPSPMILVNKKSSFSDDHIQRESDGVLIFLPRNLRLSSSPARAV